MLMDETDFDETDQDPSEVPDGPIKGYLLRTPKGQLYYAEIEDVTDDGIILEVDEQIVTDGILQEPYIDTRYLKDYDLEILFVLHPVYQQQ